VKAFLDTSVLVAAFWGGHQHHRSSIKLLAGANRKQWACSLHTLAEIYAAMTALPVKPMIPQEQVLLLVKEVQERLTPIALSETEYLATIRKCGEAGFTSGRVYDALLLLASAVKAKAETIYTLNLGHFQAIAPELADRMRIP